MATNIYLGYPPENIKNWIIANHKPTTKLTDPLCFTAEEAGSTVKMVQVSNSVDIVAPTVYLETSTTGEEGSWTDFTVCTFNEETYEPNDDGTIITLENIGDKVYFRAKQDNEAFAIDTEAYNRFVMTGKIVASGNINILLKVDGSVLDLTGRESCFCALFDSCEALIDASELLLPATTLAYGCYSSMFQNCHSLTKAPKLPATTLAECCYIDMFRDCTSLIQAPKLPAITLAENCYGSMFSYCTSLTKAPELPATTLVGGCYNLMFGGCSSLTKVPELPATTLTTYCYAGMFDSCTSLTQAPELPATDLADNCYNGMFQWCTSLTQAPELPATTLAESCYGGMFHSCKSPFTFPDKTFDEIANLIQEHWLIGDYWFYYDEEWNEIIINPVEIICSDKTMIATFDEEEYTWTLTEK